MRDRSGEGRIIVSLASEHKQVHLAAELLQVANDATLPKVSSSCGLSPQHHGHGLRLRSSQCAGSEGSHGHQIFAFRSKSRFGYL